ncbi:hypothetical protein [Arthrobacter methylotrophus]|uniref:Uncharacterized protein n=1 Tax=Arthrobacter methylotrophus TaxID=121291 RepID=A0ABV5UUW0_9MICC
MKLLTNLSAVGAACLLLAGMGASANAAPLHGSHHPVSHKVPNIHDGTAQIKAQHQAGHGASSAPQTQASSRAFSAAGLQRWTTTNTDSTTGTKYASTYIGADPALGTTSTINVYLVPLNMDLDNGDGTTTSINATTAVNDAAKSPIFANMAQKPSGENTQYIDAYMRANFNQPAGYHVKLNPVVKPAVTLNVGADQYWDYGSIIGVQDTLISDQVSQSAAYPSDGIVMYVTPGVFGDDGTGRGFGGYHDYDGTKALGFSNIQGASNNNLQALSHELSEWAFDPTVNNATAGNLSTAGYGCQKILEVGDPVNNQNFTLTDASAKTWTVEDEVFVPWFFHTNPAGTSNGKYSILGLANYGASC